MGKSRSELRLPGALRLLSLRGNEIPRFAGNKLRNLKGFAEGKRTMPGPGKKPIVLRHCEERTDEAISKWAA